MKSPLCAVLSLLLAAAPAAAFVPGDLDPTFGGAGVVAETLTTLDLAVQGDGKILAAGQDDAFQAVIRRFDAAGEVDAGYGTDGSATIAGGRYPDTLALQSDGKLLVGGTATAVGNPKIGAWRLDASGQPDATFSTDGLAYDEDGAGGSHQGGLVRVRDGAGIERRVYLCGYDTSSYTVRISRLDDAGAFDASWGTGGTATWSSATGQALALGMDLAADGGAVVSGTLYEDGRYKLLLLRFTSAGALDTAFGTGGVVIHDAQSCDSKGFGVRVLSDGDILVAGKSCEGGAWGGALLRFAADGTLDTSFGGNGVVLSPFLAHEYRTVLQEPDGRLLAAGKGTDGQRYAITLERFLGNGSPDITFGARGVARLFTEGYADPAQIRAEGLARQSDGRLLVSGPFAQGDSVLARLQNTFSRVTVLDPVKGRVLASGTVVGLRWGGTPGAGRTYRLRYSLNGGSTWSWIAGGAAVGAWKFAWNVPKPLGNKTACLINVSEYVDGVRVAGDNSDPFTIEVLRVDFPGLIKGFWDDETVTVAWKTNATARPVAHAILSYTYNGGATWNTIRSLAGNPGRLAWALPDVTSPHTKCQVRVRLADANGKTLAVDVGGWFSVYPR